MVLESSAKNCSGRALESRDGGCFRYYLDGRYHFGRGGGANQVWALQERERDREREREREGDIRLKTSNADRAFANQNVIAVKWFAMNRQCFAGKGCAIIARSLLVKIFSLDCHMCIQGASAHHEIKPPQLLRQTQIHF